MFHIFLVSRILSINFRKIISQIGNFFTLILNDLIKLHSSFFRNLISIHNFFQNIFQLFNSLKKLIIDFKRLIILLRLILIFIHFLMNLFITVFIDIFYILIHNWRQSYIFRSFSFILRLFHLLKFLYIWSLSFLINLLKINFEKLRHLENLHKNYSL